MVLYSSLFFRTKSNLFNQLLPFYVQDDNKLIGHEDFDLQKSWCQKRLKLFISKERSSYNPSELNPLRPGVHSKGHNSTEY